MALPLNTIHNSFLLAFLGVTLFFLSGQSIADDSEEIERLLDRMSRAFHELSYDGHFVYVGDNNVRSLRILHTVKNGKELERLTHLSGAAQEVIRKGHEILCLHHGDHLLRQNHSHSTGLFTRPFQNLNTRLDQFYNFVKSGHDRIAGRKTVRLSVEPVDNLRYGYTLWIDAESGLLLKSVLNNEHQKPLETFEFIQVEVVETLSEDLFTPKKSTQLHSKHYSLDVNPVKTSESIKLDWTVKWTPPGFYMTLQDKKYFPVNKEPVNTIMYTDGLAAYSVFIEKSSGLPWSAPMEKDRKKNEPEKVSIRQFGGTIAYNRQINESGDEVTVTVVGELPVHSLKRIAESVVKSP